MGSERYEGHYHLFRTTVPFLDEERVCKGFIEQNWESLIKPLLHALTDPMGSDWDETITQMIGFYEEHVL